jgi:hypothetical protein
MHYLPLGLVKPRHRSCHQKINNQNHVFVGGIIAHSHTLAKCLYTVWRMVVLIQCMINAWKSLKMTLDIMRTRAQFDTFFCHTHHPKRELIEDLIGHSISPVYSDENNRISDTGGGKKDAQSAVNQKLPPPLPLLLPLLPPPQPHQKHANHCDWGMSATCCIAPELPLQKCQMEDCNRMVHHLCQNTWHESKHYEPNSISRYCRLHDELYRIMFPDQAADDVTVDPFCQNAKGDIFYGSLSEAEDPPLRAAGNQCNWAHSAIGCVAHFFPTKT